MRWTNVKLSDYFKRDPRPDDVIQVEVSDDTAPAEDSAAAPAPAGATNEATAPDFAARLADLEARERQLADREQQQAAAVRAAALTACAERGVAFASRLASENKMFGALAQSIGTVYSQAARDDLDNPLPDGAKRTAVIDSLADAMPKQTLGERAGAGALPADNAPAGADEHGLANTTTSSTGGSQSARKRTEAEYLAYLSTTEIGTAILASPTRTRDALARARAAGSVA